MNYVNNVGSGGAVPEITTQTGTTPKQLYRNTDNKIFEPKLIVLTNLDSTDKQMVTLVDCDLTDSGEDSYKGEDYPIYPKIAVAAQTTVILNEEDLYGLRVKYGIGGYNSTSKASGSGVQVYIAGIEI